MIEYLKIVLDLLNYMNDLYHIFSSIENRLLVDNINNKLDQRVEWLYTMMEHLVMITVYQ